jgi:hypothetical protein
MDLKIIFSVCFPGLQNVFQAQNRDRLTVYPLQPMDPSFAAPRRTRHAQDFGKRRKIKQQRPATSFAAAPAGRQDSE